MSIKTMFESRQARRAARRCTIRTRVRRGCESLEPRLLLAASPVITEFMARNDGTLADGNSDQSDWIEIYNAGDMALDLAGWHLTDNPANLNKWTFPSRNLDAGEYMVVFASNNNQPDAGGQLHTNFQLSAVGEYLALVAPDGATEVSEFGAGGSTYPPQFEDISYGVGLSVEASEVLVADQSPLRWLVPDDGSLGSTWTELGFDDAAWGGGAGSTTGIGYERSLGYDALINTDVEAAMFDKNESLFVRIPFDAGDLAEFNTLTLRMKYDDGYAAYLNGVLVARSDNTPEPLQWNSGASSGHADTAAVIFEDVDISAHLGALVAGENILAIHGLNSGTNSSDMLILPELVAQSTQIGAGEFAGYFTTPTPAGPNITSIIGKNPNIRDVAHGPAQPVAGDEVTITARVASLADAIDSVELTYAFMYARTRIVEMFDDGAHGDGAAGDGVYGAVLTTDASQTGEMLRYFVSATTTAGAENRLPLFPIRSGADQSPEFFGTVLADPNVNSQIPIFQWFTADESSARTRSGARASVFYDGEFYDNIFVRLRGGSTATGGPVGKPHYKFDFPGNTFRFDADYARVEEFNLNSTASDKAYIRQSLAFETYDAVGAPGSVSFPMHVRLNGRFYGVYAFIEQPDEELLAREGLDPDGALYKMFNEFTSGSGGVEKKTRRDESNADLVSFVNNVNSLSGEALRNYLFDNVDLPRTLNYLVATVLVHQNDNPHKNHYLYRDTNGTGEWFFLPWDHDLTWGSNWVGTSFSDVIYADNDFLSPGSGPIPGHNLNRIAPSHPFVNSSPYREWNNHWNRLMDELLTEPTIREMYLRRLRSTMDQILGSADTPAAERWADQRLDEYVALLSDDAALDFEVWADPWRWGSNQSFEQAVDVIRNDYLPRRRTHLYETHLAGQRGSAGIPTAQVGNPALDFGQIEFNPVSGNQDEEFIQLVNPGDVAVDLSGWQLTGGVRHTFRPGTIIPALRSLYVSPDSAVFRARATGPSGGQGLLVQGGYNGHISNAGETIRLLGADDALVASIDTPAMPSDAQRYLRITELHYNPPGSDDTEFIELYNTSDTVTLDLADVRFTNGFSEDFNFTGSAVTSLAPGEYVLVVKDAAALAAAYPQVDAGLIAGQFIGGLSNSGETVKLEDALNGTILDFRYEDGQGPGEEDWPLGADAGGFSLVIADPRADTSAWEIGAGWRASRLPGGSPGGPDQATLPGDTNGDGVVNIDDLNNVRNNFGGSGAGDANGDGVVNIDDLNLVRNHFGTMAAPLIASSVSPSVTAQYDQPAAIGVDAVLAKEHGTAAHRRRRLSLFRTTASRGHLTDLAREAALIQLTENVLVGI